MKTTGLRHLGLQIAFSPVPGLEWLQAAKLYAVAKPVPRRAVAGRWSR